MSSNPFPIRGLQGLISLALLFLCVACSPTPSEATVTMRPRSTPTRSPLTATATPTLAIQTDGIQVSKAAEPDSWLVSGLIYNRSSRGVSAVEVEISAFDPAGDLMLVKTTQLPAHVLSPGEASPFQEKIQGVPYPENVSIQAVGYQSLGEVSSLTLDLILLDEGTLGGGKYHVLGRLINPSDMWIQVQDSYLVVLDEDSKVIDLDVGLSTYAILPPTTSKLFQARLRQKPQGEIILYADGIPIDPPSEYEVIFRHEPTLHEDDQGRIFVLGSIQNLEDTALDVILHFEFHSTTRLMTYANYSPSLPISPGEIRFFLIDKLPGLANRLDEEEVNLNDVTIQADLDPGTARLTMSTQPLEIEVDGIENTGSTLLLQCSITNSSGNPLEFPSVLLVAYRTDGSPISANEVSIAEEIQPGEVVEYVLNLPLPGGTDLTMTEFDLQAFGILR